MDHEFENDVADEANERPFDASDPDQVNFARIKAGRKHTERLRVVRALMENKECRAWLYELLAFCNIGGSPFVQGQPDATAFKLGQQNVGLMILSDINSSAPELYMTMISEGRKTENRKAKKPVAY